MARNLSRSRKGHRKHKARRTHVRRTLRGGSNLGASAAPLQYSLAGDWSSKMAQGQGGDYLKYHVGQHGGQRGGVAPVGDTGVMDASLRGPAMLAGQDQAFAAIAGLKDQAGGKRSKRSKSAKRSKSSKRSKSAKRSKSSKRSKRSKKTRGGSLSYAPFDGKGMLLSQSDYAKAGLSPSWSSNVEFNAASARASL
uniref:Uncharacterized protein n=1 Tax=viral metagenome TaxID=1070528 RepID=A0A6C0HKS4_9ZZZZ